MNALQMLAEKKNIKMCFRIWWMEGFWLCTDSSLKLLRTRAEEGRKGYKMTPIPVGMQ